MASPGDYQHFRGVVPERKIQVGMHQNKHFRYYEFGPKKLDPIICLGGAACTADCFYKQVLALSSKGYRIMAVDAPALWTHAEWMSAFDKFLDSMRINQVHLYGTSLGGFLCQLYAAYRPRRVKSLVLSNTFLDTKSYHDEFSWNSLFQWTPEFMLKRIIMAGLGEGYREAHIANSIDFVVSQLETLHQQELASRLTLMSQLSAVGHLHLADEAITIMDTNDYCSVKQDSRDALYIRYPGGRRAFLKSGGDFPFLSRADEVNLHLQLHLRRVGVEPEASADTPSHSPAQQGFSPPHYDSDTLTTSSVDEVSPSEQPHGRSSQGATRSHSGEGDEASPGGQEKQGLQAPQEEVASVGGQLAYKKDPLWAALADAEASVWENRLGGRPGSGRGAAGDKMDAADGMEERGPAEGEENGPDWKGSSEEGKALPAGSEVSGDRHAEHGEAGTRESDAKGQKDPQERQEGTGATKKIEEGDSDLEDNEGWRNKEGADPLLWGTVQGGERDKKEGAGDPLSTTSSPPGKEEAPDILGRRKSGRL